MKNEDYTLTKNYNVCGEKISIQVQGERMLDMKLTIYKL